MNKEQIDKLYQNQMNNLGVTQSQFNSVAFPMIKKISLGNTEKMEEIKSEVKSINRDNKIKSIEEDVDYIETKIQDHPDYSSASGLVSASLISVKPLPQPSANLTYMDYQYGPVESESHQIISSDPNEEIKLSSPQRLHSE